MKLSEFLEKMEHEGGFEPMADYAGPIVIEDDREFNDLWQQFIAIHEMLDAHYEAWTRAIGRVYDFELKVVGGTDTK